MHCTLGAFTLGACTLGALHTGCIAHWVHSTLGAWHTRCIAHWVHSHWVHCILGPLHTGCMHTGCTPHWMRHTLNAVYTGHIAHRAHYLLRVLHMHTVHVRGIAHCMRSALGLLATRVPVGRAQQSRGGDGEREGIWAFRVC